MPVPERPDPEAKRNPADPPDRQGDKTIAYFHHQDEQQRLLPLVKASRVISPGLPFTRILVLAENRIAFLEKLYQPAYI